MLAAGYPVECLGQVLEQIRVDSTGAWHSAERIRAEVAAGRASRGDSFSLAIAELALGRPERARVIAGRLVDSPSGASPLTLAVLGEAAFGIGEFERAGEIFALIAQSLQGTERGVFSARAGVAYEQAGLTSEASHQYRRAAVLLPEISSWLAIREARGTRFS